MLVLNMPPTFKVGDTVDCRINQKPARVTWRDKDTLVIEPGDVRQIFHTDTDDEMRVFMCSDAGAKKSKVYQHDDYVVVVQED